MFATRSTSKSVAEEGAFMKVEAVPSCRRSRANNQFVAFTTIRPGNDLMVHMGSSFHFVPRLTRRAGVGGSRRFGSAKRKLRVSKRQSFGRKSYEWYEQRCLVDDDGYTTIVKIGDHQDTSVKELLQALDPSRFVNLNRREPKVVLIQWKGDGLPVSHLTGHVSFINTISDLVPKVKISICANQSSDIDLKTLRDELDKIIASGKDGECLSYSMYEVWTLFKESKKNRVAEDKPMVVPERNESLGRSVEQPKTLVMSSPQSQKDMYESDENGFTGRQLGAGFHSDVSRDSEEPTTPKSLVMPSTPKVCPTLRYRHKSLSRSVSRVPELGETPRSTRTPVSASFSKSAETTFQTSVALRAKLFEQKASEIAASNLSTPKRNYRFNVQPAAVLTTPTRVMTAPSVNVPKSAVVKGIKADTFDDEEVENYETPVLKRQNSVRRSLRPFLKRRPQTPIRIPLAFLNNGCASPQAVTVEDNAPISQLTVDLAIPSFNDVDDTLIAESTISSIQNTPNRRTHCQNLLDGSETGAADATARSISDDINVFQTGDSTSLVDEVFEENQELGIPTPPASPNNNKSELDIDDGLGSSTPIVDHLDTITEEADLEVVATDAEDASILISKIFKPVHGSYGSLTDDHRSDVESVGKIEKASRLSVEYSSVIKPSDEFVHVTPSNLASFITKDSENTEATPIFCNKSALKSPSQIVDEFRATGLDFAAKPVDAFLLKSTSETTPNEKTNNTHFYVVEYPEMDGFVVVDDKENDKHLLKNTTKKHDSTQTAFMSSVKDDDDISAVVVPLKVSVIDRIKSLNSIVSQKEEEASLVPRKQWLSATKKAVVNLAPLKKTSSHSDSFTVTHESHNENIQKSVKTRVLEDGSVETITKVETMENVETTEHTTTKEGVKELLSNTVTKISFVKPTEDSESKQTDVKHSSNDDESVKLSANDQTKTEQFDRDPLVVESAESSPDSPNSSFFFKNLKAMLAKHAAASIAPPSPTISHDTTESVVVEENDLASLPDEALTPPSLTTYARNAKPSKSTIPVQKKRKNKRNKKNKH